MMAEKNKKEVIWPRQQLDQKFVSSRIDECASIAEQGPKSRQWTDEEHVLYILFLELNRQKIKSKLIRRSNSFYKEMSDMIKTKNLVQCRSHNQKYEEKYKYPHRIIRQEKQKLPLQFYAQIEAAVRSRMYQLNPTKTTLNLQQDQHSIKEAPKTQQKSIACQTDIQNTHMVMMIQRCTVQPVLKLQQPDWLSSAWGCQLSGYPTMWYC